MNCWEMNTIHLTEQLARQPRVRNESCLSRKTLSSPHAFPWTAIKKNSVRQPADAFGSINEPNLDRVRQVHTMGPFEIALTSRGG